MYEEAAKAQQQGNPNMGGQPGPDMGGANQGADDNVVDADYEVVDEDK